MASLQSLQSLSSTWKYLQMESVQSFSQMWKSLHFPDEQDKESIYFSLCFSLTKGGQLERDTFDEAVACLASQGSSYRIRNDTCPVGSFLQPSGMTVMKTYFPSTNRHFLLKSDTLAGSYKMETKLVPSKESSMSLNNWFCVCVTLSIKVSCGSHDHSQSTS